MSATPSLTQLQQQGIGTATNVAEGYPRILPTASQQAIFDRLPEIMADALRVPIPELERRVQLAFFGALGQASAPIPHGRVLSFYASTVAIDVVAAALARRVRTVGVVHPVIDCVPALMRTRGLRLVPIAERTLLSRDPIGDRSVEAVLTASPNNPTGTVTSAIQLERLARACAERSIPLVIDQCFRAFDPRAQFDTYAVLDRTGVEYVVVEDSGKLWPAGGVKLGFLAWGTTTELDLADLAADVLLTAPPFSMAVVERFALDMAAGGLERIHDQIATNRAIVRDELAGFDLATVADKDSRVSVVRVRLAPTVTATRLWGHLMRRGVHAVPCRSFYWARPREGERYLRIALAREPDVVREAARAVRTCMTELAS